MAREIVWFEDVHKTDIALVGGKGANLGEMTQEKIPVPPGFIVTAEAYLAFLRETGLSRAILAQLNGLNPEDSKKLQAVSEAIGQLILKAQMPERLKKDIKKYYWLLALKQLKPGSKLAPTDVREPVAVRSSATAEDLPDASFAGQQDTFLNVIGGDNVVTAVQAAWASLFEARAIYYRATKGFDHFKVQIAVPVQLMVQSEVSGIMFTIDPVTNDDMKMVIEAGLGLGEAIVSGSVTPDRYLIARKSLEIVDKEINLQPWMIVRDPEAKDAVHGDKHVSIPPEKQGAQKLADDKIIELAKIGLAIEKHYGFPQDMEWAMAAGKLYIVQTRPITTYKPSKDKVSVVVEGSKQDAKLRSDTATRSQLTQLVIVKGAAASVGWASGSVKIIHDPKDIDQVLKGDVLVTEMTTPDFVPAMKRAVAIVTDTGGRTSHAAIVSRELGIPCVVGTGTATSALKTGLMVTVDGAEGLIYKGKVTLNKPTAPSAADAQVGGKTESVPITGTKVYVNLGEPDVAEKVAQLPVDGVGLMRAEFVMSGIGEHPRAMLKAGKGKEFTQKLAQGLRTMAQAFSPRPVIYRFSDFKTNEYRHLKGGEAFEPQEANPMIGYRGAGRYIREPDLFALELAAVKIVREDYDLKNLWVMVPFVRTVDELKKVKALIEEGGLRQGNDFKLYMMVEIPSNVILLDEFIAAGVDGLSIGSNDLTQLTLGVDRDNAQLAAMFDERDPSVTRQLVQIVKTALKHSVSVGICGQAPSVFPEITELLVKAGITSVSVSPDVAISTRKLIASVERRIIVQHAIKKAAGN
jgi:pyruvate,water dikinase